MLEKFSMTLVNKKMEPCLCAFPFASPAAASELCTQLSRLVVLSFIGILISSKSSGVSALPPHSTTNGDVIVSNRSSVVLNSTREVGASSTKPDVVDAIGRHHRHHERHYERFHPSSYVKLALLKRQQQQPQQKRREGRKGPGHHVNFRKLSRDFGCLANATMCLTVPGWTVASTASTCCSNGLCTDIQFDGLNCGACGNSCSFGYLCCSSVCVSIATDPLHCGRCGNACDDGDCSFGFCGY